MNINLLRTFLEVARLRHFGRAAEGLNVTQAAVSTRIHQLEQLLGVTLFDRAGRDIKLTPAGHRMLRHADALITGWRNAQQDLVPGTAAQIALGGNLRLWDVLLRNWLKDIRRDYPDWAIAAESHSTEVLTRRLLDGLLDVAIMLEPPQIEILQIAEVTQLDLVLVSQRPGLTCANALDNNYVYVDWGYVHAFEHARAFPDAVSPGTRVSQARMALDYILSLGGAAYLPKSMIVSELKSGKLHRVAKAPVFNRTVYAVYPVRTAQLDLIEKCIALL